MKWITSFRAKLIFTVFPVVASVTIVALWMAERQFSATYRRLFSEQFEAQIDALTAAKLRRFESLSERLQAQAARPEVIAAVEKRDFKELGQILRPELEKLALERLQNELPMLRREEPGRAGLPARRLDDRDKDNEKDRPGSPFWKGRDMRFGPGQAPLIALIDPKGTFIMAPQQRAGEAGGILGGLTEGELAEVRRKGGKMPWLGDRKLEDVLKEQEVSYLHVELPGRDGAPGMEQVREVFITPLRDPKDSKFVGAFAFGLPLTTVTETLLASQTKKSEFGEIMSGTWVEGELVTSTIPASKREELSAILSEGVAKAEKAAKFQREVVVPIDGVRHQVFYRVLNPGSPFSTAAQVNLYSLAPLDAEIGELRRNVAGVGLLALLLALGAVLLVSRTLSRPVKELASATREIEMGNFSVRVPVRHRDELGALAASFNQMASGLALQERYRSVLNAVADRGVAQQLIERSGRLGGELRHVTMLFCDIRGFTALTEGMPPGEVIEMLNEHMTALTEVAYEHGGIVDKFVGDLIMVLFGAPMSTGSDAARAVQCAQDMLKKRRDLNQTSRHSFEIGIGIATGSVVAGCMGSDQRLSYTVIGHRVNLASRLCGIAQPGEIIMDDETHQEARSLIQAEPMPPMQLKGISETVHPWRAVG